MCRHSRWLGVVVAGLVAVTTASAQPELPASAQSPPSAQPPLLPPVPPAPLCGPPKPDNSPPSVVEEIKVEIPAKPAAADDGCSFYLGTDGMEYLLWWMKSTPLPPLVTRNRNGRPVLGGPDTQVIAGGEPVNYDAFSGGRFTIGSKFGSSDVGTEFNYFFLGTRTVGIGGGPAIGNIGRPVIDAVTGHETFVAVSNPMIADGAYTAAASGRAQGVEANVLANLFHGSYGSVNALVGYRFLQVHEGLFVGQSGVMPFRGDLAPFNFGDQFDAHNRFHGGQIGLRADARKGVVFAEVAGKIAFGATTEVVRISGVTGPDPVVSGGLLALPSNSGRFARDVFAVVPEASCKLGLQYENHRIFVGYDFTYLSEAVRPGDQIDRTVNLGQVPFLGGSPMFTGPERPRAEIKSSDLWLQGLMVGLETRW